MRMRPWQPALVASCLTFAGGLVGCAAHDWHAPRAPVLIAIYALGVVLGALVAKARATLRAVPDGTRGVLRAKSSGYPTLALATLFGALSAAGGAYLVATVIDDWHSLVLASVVGSLWMATYPLHPLAAHALLEGNVTAGVDGLKVGRRKVPFRAIRSATSEGRTLVLQLGNGRTVQVPLSNDVVAAAVARRVTERLAPAPAAARVGREGRSFDGWKRELVAPDYRSSQLSAEGAAEILRSGVASLDQRVGAAIVLASSGDRERIRVTASECIDPQVRVALERVADDTLDEATFTRLASREA